MKALIIISLVIITFSITKCAKEVKNKMNTEELTTTPAMSIEEDDSRTVLDVMSIMLECNDTFRVEMPYLDSLNKSGSFPDETDRTPKCFIRCVLENADVASQDSQFNVTRTAELFTQIRDVPEDVITEFAMSCSERSESCKCERSYQYMKCLLENIIDKYDKTVNNRNT